MGTLILENIKKVYGDHVVVDNLNLTVDEGELLTIVGPSGCGKTTTLRMIAGFIMPEEGRISIDEQDMVNAKTGIFTQPENRGIGMVFQSYAVWPHMNVFNNISYPLKIRKVEKGELDRRTRAALSIVHLEGLEKRMAHELSGGQQQRVALARALVMEPLLLLLDEPLSNLDAALREEMRSEIKEIQRKTGITIINVTHDQIEAMTMSDKVAVMDKGKLIQAGSPRDIYENPVNSFVAKFIGSANILPCKYFGDCGQGKMRVEVFGSPLEVAAKPTTQESGLLSVRPHHVNYDTASPINAKVLRKLYQGHQIEYYLKIENTTLRMMTEVRNDFNLGDVINVSVSQGVWLDK